jgi:predicted amidohydrolase
VLAYAAGLRTGMSICYDIRFPELYREMSAAGVDLIFVPSSFTRMTGTAHWEVLVRARAIENLSFVVAPGQAGVGAGGIETYGNSMVVDPWGRILARAADEKDVLVYADLDLKILEESRGQLPALHNRKLPFIR